MWQIKKPWTLDLFVLLAAQRSAQELPLVDKQSMESCAASGGEQMLLSGHNFQHDSKVVFVERAQGREHRAVSVCVRAIGIVLKLTLFWEISEDNYLGTKAESQFAYFP